MEAKNNNHNIVYMLDNTGKIVFINDEIKEYGYSPHELVGKNIMDIFLIHNKEKINRKLKRESNTYGVWLITKNKTVVPMEIQYSGTEKYQIMTMSSEKFYTSTMLMGTVCIARDISEYRSPYLLAMSNNIEKKLKITHDETPTEKTSPHGAYWEEIQTNIDKILHEKSVVESPTESDDDFLKEFYELIKE